MVTARTPKIAAVPSSPAPATSSGGSSSTQDILGDLMGAQTATARRVANIAESGTVASRYVETTKHLLSDLEKTYEIKEADKRTLAQEILNARMEELRQGLANEQATLAEIMKGLDDEFKAIGEEFAKIEQLDPKEAAVVASAEALLAKAKANLEAAQKAWFFKEAKVAKAEAEITTAELGVVQANEKAQTMRTRRLQSADFRKSFDAFIAKVNSTIGVIEARTEVVSDQYAAAQEAKQKSFADKEAAAKAMETLKAQVDKLVEEYAQAEQEVGGYTVGTQERSQKEAALSELKKRLEEVNGKMNQALMIFQAKERATSKLEIDEHTLLGALNSHQMLRASLRANADSWRVGFENRLVSMKAMADQDAAQKILDTGAHIDQRNAQEMAKFMMASLRTVTELAEKHPDQLRALDQVRGIQGEGARQMAERWAEIYRKTQEAQTGNPPAPGGNDATQ